MPPTNRLKRIKRKRRITFLIWVSAATLLLFILVLGTQRLLSFFTHISTPRTSISATVVPTKNVYNFLLLGYGGGAHDGTYLTDTIIVARIDKTRKKVSLVSIPRDIWVEVPADIQDFHAKINSLYQMGLYPQDYPAIDARVVKNDPAGMIRLAARRITGLPIDGYVAIDFTGFEKMIDVLGGVEIQVDRTFTDYQYPIEGKESELCDKKEQELEEALKVATQSPELAFPCRYEELHFDKGTQQMDGKTALKFARSRHSLDDGGDFNRAKRQQKVIEAVKSKMLSIGFIPKIIPLLNELEKHIKTDITLADMQSFLLEAPKAGQYTTRTYVIERELLDDSFSSAGGFILVPRAGEDNWSQIQKAVKTFLNPPHPSRMLTK